jgi:hypothetical protein
MLKKRFSILENILQLRKLPSLETVIPADIRLYVGILRLLLIDNGSSLQKSSSKWNVKLLLEVEDTTPLVRQAQNGYISDFRVSVVPIFNSNTYGHVVYPTKN